MDYRGLESERLRLAKRIRTCRDPATIFWELFSFFQNLKRATPPAAFHQFSASLIEPFLNTLTDENLSRLIPRYLTALDDILECLGSQALTQKGRGTPRPYTLDLEAAPDRLALIRFKIRLERARRYLWMGCQERMLDLLRLPAPPTAEPYHVNQWIKKELAAWERFRAQADRNLLTILTVGILPDGSLAQGELLELRLESGESDSPNPKLSLDGPSPDDAEQTDFLRNALRIGLSIGQGQAQKKALHYRLGLGRTGARLTGASFSAAAAALVANDIFYRRDRTYYRFSRSFALTGDVAESGRILPVNADTLPLKMEAAFWSRLEAVALSAEQSAEAQNIIADLKADYPNRKLDLIPLAHVRDLLPDRRAAQRRHSTTTLTWAWRRANKKYVAAAAIMATLLLGGASVFFYFLPQTRPWINREPGYIGSMGTGLRDIYNTRGEFLWAYDMFAKKRIFWLPRMRDLSGDQMIERQVDCLADVNSDGHKEILLGIEDLWHDTTKAWSQFEQIFLRHDGRLLWTLPMEKTSSPFSGARHPEYYKPRSQVFIDWDGDGQLDLVQVRIHPRGHRANCLVWIDTQDGHTKACQWKLDWWFSLAVVRMGEREHLWAGSRDAQHGFAFLAIYKDGIPEGNWDYPDSNQKEQIECIRFPIPDALRYLHQPLNVQEIRPDKVYGRGNNMIVLVENIALKAYFSPYTSYKYFFSKAGEFQRIDFGDAIWGTRQMLSTAFKLPMPASRTSYVAELCKIQRWNGRQWISLTNQELYPDSLYCLPPDPPWWPDDLECAEADSL